MHVCRTLRNYQSERAKQNLVGAGEGCAHEMASFEKSADVKLQKILQGFSMCVTHPPGHRAPQHFCTPPCSS